MFEQNLLRQGYPVLTISADMMAVVQADIEG